MPHIIPDRAYAAPRMRLQLRRQLRRQPRMRPLALALSLLAVALPLAACSRAGRMPTPAAPRLSMLVNTAWLAQHAADPNLVVLHVGTRAQYDSGHVAGARFVSLNDISLPSVQGGLSLQMGTHEQLLGWARTNGIDNKSRIVVVPHNDAIQSATRVFIALAYMGAFAQTSLLDGGMLSWRSEGRATTTAAPAAAKPGVFKPTWHPELIATLDQVEAVTQDSGRTALIDSRLPRFYNGDGGGYPRPGHIPTAVNIPLTTMSTNGVVKPVAELKRLFADAGVHGDKPIITYCHIGQQATVLWFVATLLGYDARMFDGSFQEWSMTTRLPLVGPPGGKNQ